MSTKAATSLVGIKKADADLQVIYGEVYAPNRLDTHGEMMLAKDIEKMAHRYMRLDMAKTIDVFHNNVVVQAYPIESFIARKGDPDYTPGAWVLGVKIEDLDVWEAIKSGIINGFSFQSLVMPMEAEVQVEVVRDHVGKTEVDADHDHFYFVKLDETGNVLSGVTSKAADGHFHEIGRLSVTKEAAGHSHRFFV